MKYSNLDRKLRNLKTNLKRLESVLIAYSGGVDSTFLLKILKDTLPSKKTLAITVNSEFYPSVEINFARKMSKQIGERHIIIKQNPLNNPKIVSNPGNRCYWCKKTIFKKLTRIASKNGIKHIIDGTNFDDTKDIRPGYKACLEYNVISPLKDAGFTKQDIRILSKKYNLPTWDKPSLACLASRFPYGDKITKKALIMVELAETYLSKFGFKNIRVRHYGNTAIIEVDKNDIELLAGASNDVVIKFKKLGYKCVLIDLEGYRTGSLNKK